MFFVAPDVQAMSVKCVYSLFCKYVCMYDYDYAYHITYHIISYHIISYYFILYHIYDHKASEDKIRYSRIGKGKDNTRSNSGKIE